MAFVQRLLSFSFSLQNGSFGSGSNPGNSSSVTGLRASCRIKKPGGAGMGSLDAAIYGLPLSMMNQLSTIGTQLTSNGQNSVTVTAGDADSGMGTVFQGTITLAYVDAQAMPEVSFRVVANAGVLEAAKPVPPTTQAGSGDVATLAQTMAGAMGLQFENNGVSVKLSNPYFSGTGRTQIKALAEHAGIEHIIDNGTLAIWPTNGSRSGGFSGTLSPQTGLVGYPAFDQAGIIVRALFDPSMQYGTQLTVQSDLTPACGTWTIINMEIDLESMMPKGQWFATMWCVPQSANNVGGGR